MIYIIGGVTLVLVVLLGVIKFQNYQVREAKGELRICMAANESLAASIKDTNSRCDAAKAICLDRAKKDQSKAKQTKDALAKQEETNRKQKGELERALKQAADGTKTVDDCAITYSILDDIATHRLSK